MTDEDDRGEYPGGVERLRLSDRHKKAEELRLSRKDEHFKIPAAGGCWICNGEHDAYPGPMSFDIEYDAYYHDYCAREVGVDNLVEFESR